MATGTQLTISASFTSANDNAIVDLDLGSFNGGYVMINVPSSSTNLPPSIKITFEIKDTNSNYYPIVSRGVIWSSDQGNRAFSLPDIPTKVSVRLDCLDDSQEPATPPEVTDPVGIYFLPSDTFWS
jgi:hypothetical protein